MSKPYKVIFYKDVAGEWRWRIKASNGLILATSSEGYKERRKAEKSFGSISLNLGIGNWTKEVEDG